MAGLTDFLLYLEEQVANHSVYVWGAQGESGITEAWIRKRYGADTKNADKAVAYWRRQVDAGYGDVLRAFDCSGLGVYWLLGAGYLKGDRNAQGLCSMCTPLGADDARPGDFCFKLNSEGRATHIGYVVGGGRVVEARGSAYGVVCRTLAEGRWQLFGRPPFWAAQTVARGGALTEEEIAQIAHTVAGEARGESYKGMVAVAQTIYDRLFDDRKRFGRNLDEVIAPSQFSGSGWEGDAAQFPQVIRAVREVFQAGGRAFAEPCYWFLSKRAARLYPARDAKYRRLGTIGGHTFWGDEVGAQAAFEADVGTNPTLKPGSRGEAVRGLQGLLGVKQDGVFGAVTRGAVIAFQRARGLKPDGIVGVLTWAALLATDT